MEQPSTSSFPEWIMKVLIVDDEEILRTGLVKMIERMDLPVAVVGTANDGLHALKLIDDHEPHVILTDIRMPNMDGLELIEKLAADQRRIRTIILSGYDDFDYARKAIRSGCSDYLVKPPIYTELRELLQSIYEKLSLELAKFMEESRKDEILNRNQTLLKSDFLRTLLVKKAKPPARETLVEQAERLGIPLRSGAYAVAILRNERRLERIQKYSTADWELLKYACLNICGEIFNGAPCFYDEQDQLVVLLPHNDSFEDHCEKLQEARGNLSHYLQLSYSAASSETYPFHAIADAYEEANRLLSLRLLSEKSVLITPKGLTHNVNEDITPHLKQLDELHQCQSLSEIQVVLIHWLDTVKNSGYTPLGLEKLKQELRVALVTLMQKPPIKQAEQELGVYSSVWLEQLGYADSFSEQLELVYQLIEQLTEQQKSGMYHNHAVEKAIAYIKKYYNHSINLVSISEHVHMNPAYFSVMFKKKTGIGVVEFVTDVRMDKAKKLLMETDYKTYQIAESIGYSDPAYFSKIFKRQHGMTPQEYRNTQL